MEAIASHSVYAIQNVQIIARIESSGTVLATLKAITTTELEEITARRFEFKKQYGKLLDDISLVVYHCERLSVLSQGAKTCFGITTAS